MKTNNALRTALVAAVVCLMAASALLSFQTVAGKALSHIASMPNLRAIGSILVLVPLAAAITYYDVRFRRIPNRIVLATLTAGLLLNYLAGGWGGLGTSVAGFALGFVLMFVFHVLSVTGAGDVKLFAAIGAVIGVQFVLPTLLAVAALSALIAGCTMLRRARDHHHRATVPYGVAITIGSLIPIALSRF